MFERYTEASRRVIFFARDSAKDLGSTAIEPEHLALAILQENHELFGSALQSPAACLALRNELKHQIGRPDPAPPLADIPLAPRSQRILVEAAEAVERSQGTHIHPADLLSALLKDSASAAAATIRRHSPAIPQGTLFFVAATNGAAHPGDAGALHRLVDQLSPVQLGRAQILLEALLGSGKTETASRTFAGQFSNLPD